MAVIVVRFKFNLKRCKYMQKLKHAFKKCFLVNPLDATCDTSVVGDYLKHDGHVVSVGTSYVIQGQVSCEPFALRLGLGTLDVCANIVSVASTQVRPKSAMLATSDRYAHH